MDVSSLPEKVVWVSLVLGSVCILVGLVVAVLETIRYKIIADKAEEAATAAVTKAKAGVVTDQSVQEQGAIGDTLESLAKLATSLKDLDIGTRVLVLGVALVAIAGVAAGVDAIATAIA